MPGRGVLRALAIAAILVGASCFGAAWRSSARGRHLPNAARVDRPPAGSRMAPARPSTTSPSILVPTPAVTSVAPPVRVEVAAVGLSAAIVPVGLTAAGDMEVPAPSLAGWYQLGPAPGAIGPAVLVGHVDSRAGPAVFYRLTALHAGDIVVVVRADGSHTRFVISAVTVIGKAAFPLAAVFAPTAHPELRLVTCTGPFNPKSGHDTDSLLAWGSALN